jgi:hypothetical protein
MRHYEFFCISIEFFCVPLEGLLCRVVFVTPSTNLGVVLIGKIPAVEEWVVWELLEIDATCRAVESPLKFV